MSNPLSTVAASESTALQQDERFAHTVDRQEQLYMVMFVFWLVPLVVWHIGCFVAQKMLQLFVLLLGRTH